MRFHASFADSGIGTQNGGGFFQGQEMLRAGCGKVNAEELARRGLLTAMIFSLPDRGSRIAS
jgi:hypothetical protein